VHPLQRLQQPLPAPRGQLAAAERARPGCRVEARGRQRRGDGRDALGALRVAVLLHGREGAPAVHNRGARGSPQTPTPTFAWPAAGTRAYTIWLSDAVAASRGDATARDGQAEPRRRGPSAPRRRARGGGRARGGTRGRTRCIQAALLMVPRHCTSLHAFILQRDTWRLQIASVGATGLSYSIQEPLYHTAMDDPFGELDDLQLDSNDAWAPGHGAHRPAIGGGLYGGLGPAGTLAAAGGAARAPHATHSQRLRPALSALDNNAGAAGPGSQPYGSSGGDPTGALRLWRGLHALLAVLRTTGPAIP
jgi:hypothetical protein